MHILMYCVWKKSDVIVTATTPLIITQQVKKKKSITNTILNIDKSKLKSDLDNSAIAASGDVDSSEIERRNYKKHKILTCDFHSVDADRISFMTWATFYHHTISYNTVVFPYHAAMMVTFFKRYCFVDHCFIIRYNDNCQR